MDKFKVGDKVTPVKIDDSFHHGLYEGETYLVDNAKAPGLIDIVGNFRGFAPSPAWGSKWSEEWFELADEQLIEKGNKEMTAEQIRNEILRIDVRIEEAKKDIENAEKERSVLVEKLREKGLTLLGSEYHTEVFVRPTVGDRVRVIRVDQDYHSSICEGYQFVIKKDDGSSLPYMDELYNWFREGSVVKI